MPFALTPEEHTRWLSRLGGERMEQLILDNLLFTQARGVELLAEETRRQGIHDRGTFKRGWRAKRVGMRVEFYNAAKHARWVLEGRSPGARPPPSDVIAAWLRRRGYSRKEASRMAFVVARAIGRRGIKPRPVLARVKPRIGLAGRMHLLGILQRAWKGDS
jgi:hypothetical protein